MISLLLFCGVVVAKASFSPDILTKEEKIQKIKAELKLKIEEYIIAVARKEGLNERLVLDIAKCESGLNPFAVNHTHREYSVGVFQWNLKAHPYISKQEALDPIFNINLAIEKMSEGKWGWWTCTRLV